MKNVYDVSNIEYRYYNRPCNEFDNVLFVSNSKTPMIEVKITSDNGRIMYEVYNLSLKITGTNHEELEKKLKIELRHILDCRRELVND